MPQLNTLLELRNRMKAKKPEFIRQDTDIRPRVRGGWRKPKGIHSKMRHNRRGKRKLPSPGYGSPVKVRGLHPSGLKPALVENEGQIPSSQEYGIIVSGRAGMKKRAEIIKKANEKGIRILNIDAEKFMKSFEEFMQAKKKAKESKKGKEDKKEAKKEIKKEAKAEEGKMQAESAEEKKKEEMHGRRPAPTSLEKEKDRILIKKA